MATVTSRKKARIEKEAVQIPEDVSLEILKKLPVKSLLRFSCACKTWYSTMSDPRHFRKLPSCKRIRNGYFHDIAAGFGYDGSKDDYKFVWMACRDRRRPRRRIEFDVFSLQSKTWRTCDHYPSSDITLSRMSMYRQQPTGVLSNGAIHWIVRCKDHRSSDGIRILALDLASEKCGLLESPRECGEDIKVVSLSGCLCLYTTCQDVFPYTRVRMSSGDLWMMKEYGVGSSWIKSVSLPTTLSVTRDITSHAYHPIHFSSEEGNIIVAVAENVGSREECEIRRLRVKNGASVSYETLLSVSKEDVTIVLEESLVSLN